MLLSIEFNTLMACCTDQIGLQDPGSSGLGVQVQGLGFRV